MVSDEIGSHLKCFAGYTRDTLILVSTDILSEFCAYWVKLTAVHVRDRFDKLVTSEVVRFQLQWSVY